MQITKNKVGVFDYTLTNTEGEVIDSSEGGEALVYLHGHGAIIPGLESALEGKKAGDSFSITIPPEDAYGERDESLAQTVPREAFDESDMEGLEVGMQFHAEGDDGPCVMTIVDIDGDDIHVDGNHPLAGETLKFDVKVKEVRNASAEELQHGHAHGPGGHHHH